MYKKNVVWMLFAVLALFSLSVSAEDKPTATVDISITKAGFIVGYSGGSGTLHHKGKDYALDIEGMRVGATFGVSTAELSGKVYNLKEASDIVGPYTSAESSAAFVEGVKIWRLKNENGVLLVVQGTQKGLDLSLDVGGMNIKMK